MARVNHKKVKQMLEETRKKITDRQFFTSRILAGHYEDMAAAQTRRYKYNRRIKMRIIWKPRDQSIAVTNNLKILINAGHPIVTKRNRLRQERYMIVTGLFAHELGHALFTDFLASQTYTNFLAAYKWYPAPPAFKSSADVRREKSLWEYTKRDQSSLEALQYLAHHIWNIIEDGYIESRMLNQFPGTLGQSLEFLRTQFFEDQPTVTQLIEAEEDEEQPSHIFESVMQIMLCYVKFGEIKYGEESLSDERIQTIFDLIPELDSALLNSSGKERWTTVSTVLVRCWDYIESYIDRIKEQIEAEKEAGNESSASGVLSKRLGSMAGSSEEGSGDSTPVPGAGSVPGKASNAAGRAATRALAANGSEEKTEETEDSEEGSTGSDDSESEADSEENGVGSSPQGDEDTADVSATGSIGGGKQETTDKEGGRIPYHQTESAYAPEGGEITYDKDYQRENYDRAASDIERLLEKMAEKEACKDLENERLCELNEAAQNISYGDIHSGVAIQVHRITDVDRDLETQYEEISAPLLAISKKLQKSVKQELKDSQRGGKQTGLVMGRRLDAHALCRNDGKVFYKNALPNDIPQLSVALLLDESGSMSCGDRATYARAAAIILYDFCQELDIPIMVYGHSTGYSTGVDLYSYAEFESFDRDDKYRMMDISARGSNRDGAALRFVAEQLSRRTEEIRLLILISDGQPADWGYSGTAAEEDLRGIKQEYRRKGLIFVAAAIGDDKENIERIYGDSFMDISDLNQLPVKLAATLKRYIRV